MKAKVLIKYKDRDTKITHNVGEIVEVTKARYDEILTAGNYLEKIAEKKKTTKKETESAE